LARLAMWNNHPGDFMSHVLIGTGKLGASYSVELLFQGCSIRLAPGFILRFPCRHRPIEHEAGSASGASKVMGLFRCRMETYFVCFDHARVPSWCATGQGPSPDLRQYSNDDW